MFELTTQAMFEERWFWKEGVRPDGVRESDGAFIIYFTASWCKPCKNLDLKRIDETCKVIGIPFWKCDYVDNDYTAGYCNVRSFPTFLLVKPKKIANTIQSNETEQILLWLLTLKD
jgi:hypothetical protein